MSKSQMFRALVQERLTAAAEEIFLLFERTIAEYEEELCRSKEKRSRTGLLPGAAGVPSLSPGPGLDQDVPEPPEVKEEPEEQSVKQEEEPLPVCVPESRAVCVKTEESSLLQQRQSEDREETQGEDICSESEEHSDTNDEEWHPQMETESDGDDRQVQPRDRGSNPAADGSSSVGNRLPSGAEGAEGKQVECPFCQKRMSTKQELQKHIGIHTFSADLAKRFSCSICEKKFAERSNLKSHIRTHTDEKPFSCNICKKAFTRNRTLTLHMRIHTGEKPYSCPVCPKTFTRKDHLRSHKRTHSDRDFSFEETLQLFNL